MLCNFSLFDIIFIILRSFFFQVIRDLFLMIPDVLNIIIPLWELKNKKLSIKSRYADDPSSFKELLLLVIIVISGLIIVSLL